MTETNPEVAQTYKQERPESPRRDYGWVFDLVMILVLAAAALLRFSGIDWASEQYLHPDERHLVNVETALSTVTSFGEYWDTAVSPLNPHNRGYNFFVYGTLPIFLVRYVAEWLGQTGYTEIMVIGRQLSAIADLFVVLLVYLTASRLFDRRVGLVAGAFSAFTVLQIQLSHFFAVDTFLTLFTMLSVYIAVLLATRESPEEGDFFKPWLFILFGVALGMAVASKINTAPVAIVLPLAVFVRISKLKRSDWIEGAWQAAGYMFLAAVVSLITFRVFQPYAFSGPGFFGLIPNEKWLDDISELLNQASGDFDWPPSIQWARRPIWFSFQNMVLWGMGLPMAVMAWGGFLASAWQMIKGKWRTFLVIFVWTALYFGWQSLAFNPTMRYQIPIYPTLAVFAGWAVISLCDWANQARRGRNLLRPAAALIGAATLVLTAWWAAAFTQIYNRPITRVAASDWIYQNVPGPLNLQIETGDGVYSQPLPFPYTQTISDQLPYGTTFMPKESGTLERVHYQDVITFGGTQVVTVTLKEAAGLDVPIFTQSQETNFEPGSPAQGISFVDVQPPILPGDRLYTLEVSLFSQRADMVLESGYYKLEGPSGTISLPINEQPVQLSSQGGMYSFTFTTAETSSLQEVYLMVRPLEAELAESQTFRLTISENPDYSAPAAYAEVVVDGLEDGRNTEGGVFELNQPLALDASKVYFLQIENLTPGASAAFSGTPISVEGDWDDALPMRTSGYDGYSGIYPRELGFHMYAEDEPAKLERFLKIMDRVEYITISSSRMWANTPRIPERYPLNVVYYRNLLGCPPERTIEWCYNVAEPGMFEGSLGFELIQTFQSDPEYAGVRINDQFAEEAFTVYDHPKVFIFQKQPDYDHQKVSAILSVVDFEEVIRLTPQQASDFKSLLLSDAAFARQRQSGTWSELFDSEVWYNRSGFGAAALWYLALTALGWAVFPLVRRALPGLPDSGFPLVRTAGLLLLAYLSWLAGSVGLGYTRPIIAGVFVLLIGAGIWQAYVQRDELTPWLRRHWRSILAAELVFLAGFLLVLGVRYGNPDLWHPFKGGEKPMDFAYFNAILKTISFPAYDPWYAGGYINYYYFGFVFVGTLVKLLGIIPALAYNLVLPTVFAMIFTGAYSVSSNLYRAWQRGREQTGQKLPAWVVGLSGALITAVLGNQGTIRLVLEGIQKLAAGGIFDRDAGFITKLNWLISGIGELIRNPRLPYSLGDYYWIPSRVIPAINEPEPITEFPWFTTIYADLHAHFMSLALVFLALAWAMAVIYSKAYRGASRWQVAWSFVFAGVAIGALRPTNTWDLPAYLVLGVVALIFAVLRYAGEVEGRPGWQRKLVWVLGGITALVGLTFLLYQPYAAAYGLPYSEIMLWKGTHTPITSYFVHWGLFLFLIVFWMGWETRQWMASTPLSSLRKLEPYRSWLWAALGAVLLLMAVMALALKVRIQIVALPLAVWAAVLLFRPKQSDSKRIVLFLIGTALFLTMLVEVIVLSGDIGRMNTVFKFYLQAWVLLGASAAASFGWSIGELRKWRPAWQNVWMFGLMLLAFGAAAFPVSATSAKIRDRMSSASPNSLDGMIFMQSSEYIDEGGVVYLNAEYDAIRWMQENISGTPVIVEANTPLYRWGSRFSIYTGLPTVLGWDWHQTQQRGFSPASNIAERQQDIRMFYQIDDRSLAEDFLREYHVEYVIVGQLERNYYPGAGLDKFENLEGDLWQEVYRNEQTVVYKVLLPIVNESIAGEE